MTVPGANPVTSPVLLILATELLLFCQLNVAFTVLPLTSIAVAVNCCVPPTLMVAEMGKRVTDAITGVTFRVTAMLVIVPVFAVICVLPGARPVATPVPAIEAMVESLLAQVKVCPKTIFPLESSAVAVNAC